MDGPRTPGTLQAPAGTPVAAPPSARRAYWNQPTLGWWERLVLPEVARGLAITGGVFVRNMWKWMTGRKGAVTACYPEEIRADYSPNNRGRHVLTQRPDGSPQCVACNLCATTCPAYCIEIVAGANPADRAHPKSPVRFAIDYSRCVFCGFCVEACPEDAIRMSKDVPALPGFDRDAMWGSIDLLKGWQPATDPRKPYPPAPQSGAPVAPPAP